jgi:hypothetical protein
MPNSTRSAIRLPTRHTCFIHLLLILALVSGASSCKKADPPKLVTTSPTTPFEVGQVWAYKNRKGEDKSQFVICKIEDDPKFGRVVHLAIAGLKMRNLRSPTGFSDNIAHMPFQEAAVRVSVVELVGTTTMLPPYEPGYDLWKAATQAGRGGIWTVPIAQALTDLEIESNQLRTPATQNPATAPGAMELNLTPPASSPATAATP